MPANPSKGGTVSGWVHLGRSIPWEGWQLASIPNLAVKLDEKVISYHQLHQGDCKSKLKPRFPLHKYCLRTLSADLIADYREGKKYQKFRTTWMCTIFTGFWKFPSIFRTKKRVGNFKTCKNTAHSSRIFTFKGITWEYFLDRSGTPIFCFLFIYVVGSPEQDQSTFSEIWIPSLSEKMGTCWMNVTKSVLLSWVCGLSPSLLNTPEALCLSFQA